MKNSTNREEELAKLIVHHKVCYYQGKPEISDVEYDKLEEELAQINSKNYALQMVGTLATYENKVAHEKKMLSLNKSYALSELKEWIGSHDVLSMYKVDGVSCSLLYEKGLLKMAKTRGDGSFGEDITAKVLWMDSVPKTVSASNFFEVRGELCCFEENFFSLAKEMEEKGLERPTSQRNIVAGLISRKDNLELNRHLNFLAFDYISDENGIKKESEKFNQLKSFDFEVVDVQMHKNFAEVEETILQAQKFMEEGKYRIDGLVFVYDDLSLHEELGETAHHPRYKMAFKFRGESKETTIEEIKWQVSRNGILTPVARVSPVELSGAEISNVTLHNYGLVKNYKLKAGDKIQIMRSGEVIPKFISVIKSSEEEFTIPEKCPVCGAVVEQREIRLFCTNMNCPGKVREMFLSFVQKIGIEDFSSKRIDQLIEKGLVKKISDLYRLSVDDLYVAFKKESKKAMAKVEEKKLANKIYNSIQASKQISIVKFLVALGVAGGATNKCEKIVRAGIDSVEKIKKLTATQLLSVESFAEKSANDFVESLKERLPLIDELMALGFNFESGNALSGKLARESNLFEGKSFCITGALSEKRSAVEDKIKKNGGEVVSAVSKNTDYLLTNEEDSSSSKYKKAKELNISIVNEEWLKNKLEK